MALRFYNKNIEGEYVALSNGDLTNPLIFDGYYPAEGDTINSNRMVYIKADTGEEYKNVLIGVSYEKYDKFRVVGMDNKNDYGFRVYAQSGGQGYNMLPCMRMIPVVNDTEYLPITVKGFASGNENNSPDTSGKLMALVLGGKLYE